MAAKRTIEVKYTQMQCPKWTKVVKPMWKINDRTQTTAKWKQKWINYDVLTFRL